MSEGTAPMMRKLAHGLTPRSIQRAAERVLGRTTRYSGPYGSWAEAQASARGYGTSDIVERVAAATVDVLEGRGRFEQDGVAFTHAPPPTPPLSGLLLAAALDAGNLRVVDFGGGLGGTYFKWRDAFDALASVDWLVVEQESFVLAGQRLLGARGLPLRFSGRLPAEIPSPAPSAVLIGSSLQYVEDPLSTLARLAGMDAKVLILDRTPFSGDDREHLLVQHVTPKLYPASYPIHLLSSSAVRATLSVRYRRIIEFGTSDSPVQLGRIRAAFSGSIWLRVQ